MSRRCREAGNERSDCAHGGNRARAATALIVLGLLGAGFGCGSDTTPEEASDSPDAAGFDPPPIQLVAPDAVKHACEVSSPTIDGIEQDGVLFWAIGMTAPFGFKLENGTWAGVEAQNAAELAAMLGVDLTITEYSYDVLPTSVATGAADIAGAQLFVTDERKQLIDFSTPYYLAGQLFYVLERSNFQTIDDLNRPDVRFVYGFGTAQRLLAEKYVPKARITDAQLNGRVLLYDQLAAGQADATMTDATAMRVLFEQFDDPALAAIGLKGRVTRARAADDELLDPFDVAFGLPKGDDGWRGCVNAWVDDLLASGRMAERLDYWLAQSVE